MMLKGLIHKIQLLLQSQVNSVLNPAGSAGLGPGLLRCSLQLAPTSFWITPRVFPQQQDGAQSMRCSFLPAPWPISALQCTHILLYFLVLGSFPALESPLRLLLLDAYTSSNHISSGDTTARPWITQHQEQSHCVVLSLWIPAETENKDM